LTSYIAPLRDYHFILHDFLKISEEKLPGFSEFDKEFTKSLLIEAAKIGQEELSPINQQGDQFGCKNDQGTITTPPGFKKAFKKISEGGWPGLDCDPEYGGQGLPLVFSSVVGEIFSSSNMALTMYQGLTHGAYSTIHSHGTLEQKKQYLPKMVSCEWTGTMNLTEPHCGTDLGLMRTKAILQQNQTYRISGQKIFISSGDHDLSENIIHLVLAKIPDSAEGSRGISLFIVPKLLLDEHGIPSTKNNITVGKIEKKMGINGNATCVLNYDEATGYLLGEINCGLKAMFVMMNEARLGVGIQGLGQAEAAFQKALDYAKTRTQGREVGSSKTPSLADPILVHPDIRRSLMDQKSFVEGGRAFSVWIALLLDKGKLALDKESEDLASLLTPVLKAFLTDMGFDMTVKAQQIFGGHGYIEDLGMSQLCRDARIAMIYEGANGIQAVDLVGRKLLANNGKSMTNLINIITDFIGSNINDKQLKKNFLIPLELSLTDLKSALEFLMSNGIKNPNIALGGATDFLHLLGNLMLGFMWSQMAKVAYKKTNDSASADNFFLNKLKTGSYYMSNHLPMTNLRLKRLRETSNTIMEINSNELHYFDSNPQ
jgi:alkylation response protein AidB-like acyl-CoA dehydrogenase